MADQKKYTDKLANSRVLVIGGSSGIGYAVAEACVEHGAIVHISSSNPSRIETAITKLLSAYPSAKSRVRGTPVDLSSPTTLESEIEKLFKDAVKDMPEQQLDHVIFTAADPLAVMPLKELSVEKILKAGQIRFVAPLLIAKFLPAYLPGTPNSSYTITTGGISEKPAPNWSVIGAYAGGHHSMVRNLALDLKPIRVCGVSPGAVDTELWTMPEEAKQKMFSAVASKMGTGQVGRPEDVAESYLAILKDRNMDGSMIRTDGGGMLM